MPNLPLVPGSLANPDCYPARPSDLINEAFEQAVAIQASVLSGVLLQEATPTAEQTGFVWARLVGGTPVFPFLWAFYDGSWKSRHPVPAGDLRPVLFTGLAAQVDTLDGGAAGVIGDAAGPFWEIDSAFAARTIVGVGTLPVLGTMLAVGDTGGEDAHVLTQGELPAHKHLCVSDSASVARLSTKIAKTGNDILGGNRQYDLEQGTTDPTLGETSIIGSGTAHQNMPPYRAVYLLRRTSRVWCTQPIS